MLYINFISTVSLTLKNNDEEEQKLNTNENLNFISESISSHTAITKNVYTNRYIHFALNK